MNEKEEKAFEDLKKALLEPLRREILQLNRKLKHSREQRDDWKEKAMSYRKTILNKNDDTHSK